ncbi:MAG: endonuclease III [Candidatus Woesearchaeota archaeon]|jgi:endonuclease III
MKMDKSFDIDKVYTILKKEVSKYKVPIVDLIQIQTKDPFKVLVTTILSARTNDRTTTEAARRLFDRVGKLSDFDKLSLKEIEKLIYPVGFYKNKAKFLKQLHGKVLELFDGKIPDTVDELVKLPGVGRKTANLVVAIAFDKPAICVDTHVHRIMNIWGYVKTKTPFDTEMALRKKLPIKYWKTINSIIVAFGQNLCRPVSPHCSVCPIYDYCPRIGVISKIKKVNK